MSEQLNNPFGEETVYRPRISLQLMFLFFVLTAAASILLVAASRVPVLANVFNDFWGLPRSEPSEKPDRTLHLIFLLLCYSGPLLLIAMLKLVHLGLLRLHSVGNAGAEEDSVDSPFA